MFGLYKFCFQFWFLISNTGILFFRFRLPVFFRFLLVFITDGDTGSVSSPYQNNIKYLHTIKIWIEKTTWNLYVSFKYKLFSLWIISKRSKNETYYELSITVHLLNILLWATLSGISCKQLSRTLLCGNINIFLIRQNRDLTQGTLHINYCCYSVGVYRIDRDWKEWGRCSIKIWIQTVNSFED